MRPKRSPMHPPKSRSSGARRAAAGRWERREKAANGERHVRSARCLPGCPAGANTSRRLSESKMRCSSTLPADLVLAIVGSGSAYPIGCLPSSMRDGRSSRSVRSSFSGSAPPGRTAPQRSCSSRPCSCCSRQEAIWPTTAPSRSRSATAGAVLCAAMIKFAVLPALQTFPGPVDKAGSRAGPQRGDLPTSDDRPGRWSDHCAHVPGHD